MSVQARPICYLDDLHVGPTFTFGSQWVDEEQVKAFAAQFDPQPFHKSGAGMPSHGHVRFWPKADMGQCTAHVRFWG